MPNQEHLRILKEGVDAWKEWRLENAGINPGLWGADLAGADLRWADFMGANLCGANLQGTDLRWTCLVGADLRGTNIEGVELREAYLNRADLRGADLTEVDLREADMREADLRGANLANSDFAHARVDNTVFGDNDLSTVKGLETVQHQGPSTIGIDTIFKSKGNIPEVFLRGAGVPEDFIVYMRSLVGKAIEFYSCFISYSSKDNAFAQRLHSDLQQKGVRCWFASEDLKIGDKFRMRIDESIRVYDKVMVVLSDNSIRSPWVEEEVEAALEKERKQSKLVLFPIRLDDAVMETDQAWAASLRRTRHIGDFRAWKDHDQYQKSFERLLHDLKA
ncbi:MAG: toll/interleukin-1 receptor domain-containing protein [Terriglobia bacterium]